ncbi:MULTISPECIES: hypothetical protein [unclassified Nocardiopsis]
MDENETDLGPFAPGDAERFRLNSLIALSAFVSVTLLAFLTFLLMS